MLEKGKKDDITRYRKISQVRKALEQILPVRK
jgi:hypothetical protein